MSRSYDLLTASFRWLNLGVSVVPVLPMSKACVIRWRSYESRRPDANELRAWFRSGDSNLAVVCGTGGLLVLDFDDLNRFIAWRTMAGQLADTYTEFSGRGVHLFYQVDNPQTARFIECEALGLGHLCLVVPSVHPSGVVYRPLTKDILQVQTEKLFSLLSKPTAVINQAAMALASKRAFPPGGSLIDQIKASFDLLTFAQSLTQLRPSGGGGRWWIGKCPLHDDENPSMWVDTVRGVWRCYSPSCPGHRGGDVLNLYALANKKTLSESIRELGRMVES